MTGEQDSTRKIAPGEQDSTELEIMLPTQPTEPIMELAEPIMELMKPTELTEPIKLMQVHFF